MPQIDELDSQLLNLLQDNFPVNVSPYLRMAEKLQVPESEVIKRIERLITSGLIRRIGGIMDSRKLGFYSTLCACRVAEDRIEEVANIINRHKEVTHNYIRNHDFNIWFTLTVSSPEQLKNTIKNLEDLTGVTIYSMPATRLYKIKVSLEMGKEND
ncbi:MAG: AsnC family transcriptional regulator [Syntrophomonadaceae bacterium]|jgi:DNA-binding Lrp family transcriptional regulator